MTNEKRTITTEFKNNGVFRYYLKNIGFKLVVQDDINIMYFVDSEGNQIKLKYAPTKTITLINKNGFTQHTGETCTKKDIELLRKNK